MTDYAELVERLCVFMRDGLSITREAADAIEQLVTERDQAVDRAEKAEADLAAARDAILWLDGIRGGEWDHFDRVQHAPAIAAARAEGGGVMVPFCANCRHFAPHVGPRRPQDDGGKS